jgi:hypothetical protein
VIIRRIALQELSKIKGKNWIGFMGCVSLKACVARFKKRMGREPVELIASRNNLGRLVYIR